MPFTFPTILLLLFVRSSPSFCFNVLGTSFSQWHLRLKDARTVTFIVCLAPWRVHLVMQSMELMRDLYPVHTVTNSFKNNCKISQKKHTSLLAGNIFKLSFNHGTKYGEAFAFMHPYVVNCNLSSAVVILSEGDKFLKKLLCCVGGRV